MIVIVCGMPRSGSTFSFHIVKEILEHRDTTQYFQHGNIDDAINQSSAKHTVIKTHYVNLYGQCLLQNSAVKGVCTTRDYYEAIASSMDIFEQDIDKSIDSIRKWAIPLKRIEAYMLMIQHQDIINRPGWVIWKIARYLGVILNPFELLFLKKKYDREAIKNLSVKFDIEDKNIVHKGTFYQGTKVHFHRRHVRPEHRILLTPEQKRYIDRYLMR